MDKIQAGKIRKITIGDLKTGFSFTVGQKIQAGSKEIEISEIIRDENNFYFFNVLRYIIYVKQGDETFIWNTFENHPMRVEYFL